MKGHDNDSHGRHRVQSTGAALALAAALALHSMPGFAAPTAIPAQSTTLESDADRMISFRHQEHMWQTSDRATHAIINRGTQVQAGSSLRLYSSFDAGQTWTPAFYLGGSNQYSTSDGLLVDDELSLAYSSVNGNILFSVFRYDPVSQTWTLEWTETAFQASESRAINPAIAFDAQGGAWCAFVNLDNASGEASIKLVHRANQAGGWQDTGLVFGSTDNISVERSARPIALSNGVGMVYTVHQNTYWAYRLNGWPAAEPWIEQTLFTSEPPYDTDPFASHFSIIDDANGNLHLAMVDHGRLVYFRYLDRYQLWRGPRILTDDVKATYPQVTLARGKLSLFFNVRSNVAVFQSEDAGRTFTYAYLLTHEPSPLGSEISYDKPRIETPGRTYGSIPVLQHYEDGVIHKALYFDVPAVPVER